MSIREIEAAITRLPVRDVADLLTWLSEFHAQLWDRQIEEDASAGRLDSLLDEVEREYQAGLARPL